jgi:16S rRNA (guanine527-N7)-methyltransferase
MRVGAGVSRETETRLEILCTMVERWNKAINLVAPNTVAALQDRHIMDSAQIVSYATPDPGHWVDLGSGGGFPGLVVAAYLKETGPSSRVTLIESDQRKAVFLREASRAMGLDIAVISARVEDVSAQMADVISARALAPLPRLLGMAVRHLKSSGTAIFPKGSHLTDEMADALRAGWSFDASHHKSATDPDATILVLRNISLESSS